MAHSFVWQLLTRDNVWWGIRILLMGAGLVAAVLALRGFERVSRHRGLIAAGWALVPPLFFLVEWKWGVRSNIDGTDLAYYQQSQALAAQLWSAIAAVLGALYLQGPSGGKGAAGS